MAVDRELIRDIQRLTVRRYGAVCGAAAGYETTAIGEWVADRGASNLSGERRCQDQWLAITPDLVPRETAALTTRRIGLLGRLY